jgi:hypothetical protein
LQKPIHLARSLNNSLVHTLCVDGGLAQVEQSHAHGQCSSTRTFCSTVSVMHVLFLCTAAGVTGWSLVMEGSGKLDGAEKLGGGREGAQGLGQHHPKL